MAAPAYPTHQVELLTAGKPKEAKQALEALLYRIPPERIVSVTHGEGTDGAFFGSGAPYISILVVIDRTGWA